MKAGQQSGHTTYCIFYLVSIIFQIPLLHIELQLVHTANLLLTKKQTSGDILQLSASYVTHSVKK